MQSRNIIYSLLLASSSFSISQAQIADSSYNGVNDPLSSYGLGTIDYDGQQTSSMMGHTGAAHQSTFIMNSANPASIASIRITTLDFSLQGINSKSQSKDQNLRSGQFRPSYFYLSFPVGTKGGMSMGVDQKLNTLYRINSIGKIPVGDSLMEITQKWVGRGSLSYFNLTGAYRWKDFSFGARLDYNFGNQQTENYIQFEDSTQILGSDYLRNVQYRGLGMRFGVQYTQKLSADSTHKLTAGFVFEPRSNISARQEYFAKNFILRNNFTGLAPDTFTSVVTARGKYHAPYAIRFGLGYVIQNKMEVLADYNYIDFRESTLFDDSLNLSTFQKISMGMNYTPTDEPGRSTLSRSTYYTGFYFGKDYILANGNPVNFWGVTGGLSIPFNRNIGSFHLGIEYGSRGNVTQNLVKMNNTTYMIGVSFSDIWFRKRFYD